MLNDTYHVCCIFHVDARSGHPDKEIKRLKELNGSLIHYQLSVRILKPEENEVSVHPLIAPDHTIKTFPSVI